MLSTGEEIRSPQRSSRSGPILAKMPCTISDFPFLVIFLTFQVFRGLSIHSIVAKNVFTVFYSQPKKC